MQELTTMRIRTTTKTMLKRIAEIRCRNETQEQVILELIHQYMKALNEPAK